MRLSFAGTLIAVCLSAVGTTYASSLQVSPVLVEVGAPTAASTLRVRNGGDKPLAAQVRVYRWRQSEGADELVETRDVVASPPIAEIAPGKQQIVRLVRIAKTPIEGEESYRVLVDELPQPAGSGTSGVNFVIRQSIPVFFSAASARRSRIEWSVVQLGRQVLVSAHNPGDRFIRISQLKLTASGGRTLSFGDGLTGYALARSTVWWSIAETLGSLAGGAPVQITAQTESGPLEATSALQSVP